MSALAEFKQHLQPGKVYRRAEMARWSSAADRHLKQLTADGTLKKLSGGLYLRPKATTFGDAPADDAALVRAFLKDDRFLLTSPNAYNALGLGTTQLYNETLVYNHKRHGHFRLGQREFRFAVKPHFPSKLTPEFMLVDAVNNLEQLAEDQDEVLAKVKARAKSLKASALRQAVQQYGGARAKRVFADVLSNVSLNYG